MMFLPFGRNNGKGTCEMRPLDGEGISMMNGVSETCPSVPVSILKMSSSKTTEEKYKSNKEGCRTCFRKPTVSSKLRETSCRCCKEDSTITPIWKD
jgi:hypothetical protein